MSAIAGVLQLDGGPVDRAHLERMAGRLAHRGPDGRSIRSEGSIGLVQLVLNSAPGSVAPGMRGGNHRDGVAVVADARLDNQEELMTSLKLPSEMRADLSAVDLISAAYLRWG